MRYAAENCSLREEIRALRSLDSVRSTGEIEVQSLTALEKTFLQLLEAQRTDDTTEGEDYLISIYIFFFPNMTSDKCVFVELLTRDLRHQMCFNVLVL